MCRRVIHVSDPVSIGAMMLKKLLKTFAMMGIALAMAAPHAQTTVRYLHTDALGMVVTKTDANGNVCRADYVRAVRGDGGRRGG